MAVQEVVRDWIFLFDTAYYKHYEHRLSIKDTNCRSCGKSLVNTFVHAAYKATGSAVKRHLSCAVYHKVLTLSEAKHLASRKALEIDWTNIELQIAERAEARAHMAKTIFWGFASICVMTMCASGIVLS